MIVHESYSQTNEYAIFISIIYNQCGWYKVWDLQGQDKDHAFIVQCSVHTALCAGENNRITPAQWKYDYTVLASEVCKESNERSVLTPCNTRTYCAAFAKEIHLYNYMHIV